MSEAEGRTRKCRAHAEQCRAQAELTHHPSVKQAYLRVAEQWERLAIEIREIEEMSRSVVERTTAAQALLHKS